LKHALVNRFFALIAALSLTAFGLEEERLTVYLIGDSTMSVKEPKVFPETGWGMPFVYFFDSSVVVENHARNGRSTRTFLSEDRWNPVFAKLRAGDHVFIQFGHNDESKEKTDRYTTPQQFKENLTRFITDTRSKGAVPVLLTPVSRRKFDAAGKAVETHVEYSGLTRDVARETGVAFIDLDARSIALYQSLGAETSKLLFLQLEPGEHPAYPAGRADNTHFSELGARKVAQLVLKDLVALNLPLAARIIKRDTAVKR